MPWDRSTVVPYSLKDLTPTKGIRTTFGSKIFEHHVPTGRPPG